MKNLTFNKDIELELEVYKMKDHGFHLPLNEFSKEVTIYILLVLFPIN